MRLLFIGGCKSGKSSTAQRIAKLLGENAPLYYWATMEPHDDEDLARIRRHIADRDGWGFTTVERARDLTAGLAAIDPAGTVLFDSVTACLAAQMFDGGDMDMDAPRQVAAQIAAIRPTLCACATAFSQAARTTTRGRRRMSAGWRTSAGHWRRNSMWCVR